MFSTIQNYRTYTIILVISILLLLSDHFLKLTLLRSLLELPIIPGKSFFYRQKQDFDTNLLFIANCQACQQQLNNQHYLDRQFSSLAAQLNQLQQENASLRKLLGAPLPPEWQYLPARVIGQTSDTIYINQGNSQGIRSPMTVIAQGVLIGQVISTTQRQSQVNLISSSTKIPARVISSASQQTLAKGVVEYQDNRLILSKVLPSETLANGDLVVTSGEGDFLPDIPIAIIDKSFMTSPTDAFQQAVLIPLADLDNLNLVEVVIDW